MLKTDTVCVSRCSLYAVGVRVTLQRKEDNCPVVNNETGSACVMCRDEELDVH